MRSAAMTSCHGFPVVWVSCAKMFCTLFTVATFVALVLLGFAVGAFGTLVGAGGGFILTPVLLILYPADSAATITAVSLVAVFWNAASGSIAYTWQRRIDYRTGLMFAISTLPGAIAGAVVVQFANRRFFDAVTALLLAGLAVWIVTSRTTEPRTASQSGRSIRRITDRDGKSYDYSVPVARGAIFSVGVGFISAFLGIGGGVIHVPLLVELLGFPVHIATATSHFILAIMSGTSSLTHVALGSFMQGHGLRRAASLSVGVVAGAQLGALLSKRIAGDRIRQLLALGLIALAVRLGVSVL
jgi:uncharacterized membrane protein YfcA